MESERLVRFWPPSIVDALVTSFVAIAPPALSIAVVLGLSSSFGKSLAGLAAHQKPGTRPPAAEATMAPFRPWTGKSSR